ncbi:MAG TPA: hypothetical protein VGD64_11780 [Acidisarcina sp.]
MHGIAFLGEWNTLFKGETTTSVAYDDKRPGWWTQRIVLSPECIARVEANQLSLELGEFAYQLRAALDGLIWDTIAHVQGCEPPTDAKGLSRLEFPLASEWKARDVEDGRFHGFPFPQKLVDWMRTIQPGTADKPSDHPDCGLQNTLEDIHNLARMDRHRRLRVISMPPLTRNLTLTSSTPPGGDIVESQWLACDPLNGKYDIVRIKVVGPGGMLPYGIYVEPKFTFRVFVEGVEDYEGKGIGDCLGRFVGAVERVIDRFDEEFR